MKKLYVFLLVVSGVIAIALLAVHLLLTYKSKELFQRVVKEVSHGKYKADAEKVTFFYSPAGIKAEKLQLVPALPGVKQATISFSQVEVRLSSLGHLLFKKELNVERLELHNPQLVAYAKNKSGTQKKGIAETISEIEHHLFSAVDLLKVRNLLVKDAALKIYTAGDDGEFFSTDQLNIRLDNIVAANGKKTDKPVFHFEGEINLQRPSIHLADSNLSVSLGSLRAETMDRSLFIDSLEFIKRNTSTRNQQVSLSAVRIRNFNWNRFLDEGLIELDSVIAISGSADIRLMQDGGKQKDTVNTTNKSYAGNSFIIHHTMVSGITYKLTTRNLLDKSKKQSMLTELRGDSLYIGEFTIIHGRKPALHVEQLDVHIKDFRENDSDNDYELSLGDLAITNTRLTLKDYRLKSHRATKNPHGNSVFIESLHLDNYSLADLFEKRLTASGITVINPEVTLELHKKTSEPGSEKKNINTVVEKLTHKLTPKVKLGEIVVQDGAVRLQPASAPSNGVTLSGLSLMIDASELPKVTNLMQLLNTVKQLNSDGFSISGKGVDLVVKEMRLLNNPRGLRFGSVVGRLGGNNHVNLRGVTLLNANNMIDISQASSFHLSTVSVDSGSISIKPKKSNSENKPKGIVPVLRADHLSLNNIRFEMELEKTRAKSAAINLDIKDFLFDDQVLSWSQLATSAGNTSGKAGNTNFSAGSLTITQPGVITIKEAAGDFTAPNAKINFRTDQLELGLGLQSSEIPSLKVKHIRMHKPVVTIAAHKQMKEENATWVRKKVNPQDIQLAALELIDPTFDFVLRDESGSEVHQSKLINGHLLLTNIKSMTEAGKPEFSVSKIRYETSSPSMVIGPRHLQPSNIKLMGSNLLLNPETDYFSLRLDTAIIKDIKQSLVTTKNDTFNLDLEEVGLIGFPYAKGDRLDWRKLLHSSNWWVKGKKVQYHTQKQVISFWQPTISNKNSLSLAMDSFAIYNRKTKDESWAETPYEKGYHEVQGGNLTATQISIQYSDNKPLVHIARMSTDNLRFSTAKDKTKIEDTISYRPLLARQLLSIPLALKVDSIFLHNASVYVNDISKKTSKEMQLYFTGIDGYISNLKTHDVDPPDTLDMRVSAKFYNTDRVRLHYKQSYDDSLQGFWMRARMSRFSMPEMNKMLTPLIGLKINSGQVDSLLLVANGNDLFAFGTMDLRYHNLKVKLLKTSETKGKFLISIANFVTGTFLRSHDNGRTDLLYKERLRKRGIFNFWGKIALEGLLTNIGVRSDKKEKRKFKKSIHYYKLPESYWHYDDE